MSAVNYPAKITKTKGYNKKMKVFCAKLKCILVKGLKGF